MVLSFLHGPIRIPMVFILQQDRDRRPRLHHIQRLRRYENWLSCRRLSRRRLSFRQRRGSFPFRRLLYHRPLFLQLSAFSLSMRKNTHKLPLSHLLWIFLIILFSRFLIISSPYPLSPCRIYFTFSVCRSSQKIWLTLFRLILLFINPCSLRYRYNSFILKSRINMLHIASDAP